MVPTALAALLTTAIIETPFPSQDLAAAEWITEWEAPGLSGFFILVGWLTGLNAGLIYGAVGLPALLLVRQQKTAVVFAVVGGVVAAASFMGDFTLGELVARAKPFGADGVSSYPSGHVFGGTVFFGFLALLPFHHRLQPKFSVPMVFVLGLLVVTVGPSRIYGGDHWPSDLAAAYLLAAALLMVLVPMYRRFLQTGSVLGFTLPQFLNR